MGESVQKCAEVCESKKDLWNFPKVGKSMQKHMKLQPNLHITITVIINLCHNKRI